MSTICFIVVLLMESNGIESNGMQCNGIGRFTPDSPLRFSDLLLNKLFTLRLSSRIEYRLRLSVTFSRTEVISLLLSSLLRL